VLTVLVPHLQYTTLVLTEALFYPAFLWFCLVSLRALENPSVGRQVAVWITFLFAYAVRTQAIVLVIALVSAILLVRQGTQRHSTIRRWAPTLGVCVLSGAGLAIAFAVGARPLGGYSPRDTADGGYSSLLESVDPVDAAVWALRSLGALSLAVGLVAMVAFLPALARLRHGDHAEVAFGAFALAVVGWMIVAVGHYSSTPAALGLVHERNVFVLIPLVLVAVAAWTRHGLPRPLAVSLAGSLGVILSVGALRQRDLLLRSDVDTPSFPLWRSLDSGVLPVSRLVLLAALVAVAVGLSTRRGWILPLTAGLAMVAAISPPSTTVDRETARRLAWVDDAAGKGGSALVVHAGLPDRCRDRDALEKLGRYTEFFNISARHAAHVFADNPATNLRSARLTVQDDGLLLQDRLPLSQEWVVIDSRIELVGTRIDALPGNLLGQHPGAATGLTLWKVRVPARITNTARVAALARRPDCVGPY
jgi:hypothetical protein